VPLLTRGQTDVLGRLAWDLLKTDFIYATWVERATAEARAESQRAMVNQ
jgi:predicted solute-binding protein